MNIKLIFQICEKWLKTRDKELKEYLKQLLENELNKLNNNMIIEEIEILRNENGVKFMTIDKYSNRKEKGWIKYYGAVKRYQIYLNNMTLELTA